MALDNAQFISELSIVDPPGTDPLSQGDDQIRTIKRATQQSFPNIDAAVTLTAVQLNLAAIKNEANVFTEGQTLNNAFLKIDAVSDATIRYQWASAGTVNWELQQLTLADNNRLSLRRNDALGGLVDRPWEVDLTTGVVDFAQPPTVAGAPLWIAGEIRMFAATATPGTNWFLADGLNGTVNMTERVPMQAGGLGAGTLLSANIIGTSAVGVSGGTALTEANLASHRHRVAEKALSGGQVQPNPATVLAAGQGLAGVILSTGTPSYADQTTDPRPIVENTGGGTVHTHPQTSVGVTEVGDGRDVCRPHSVIVEMHQYVP